METPAEVATRLGLPLDRLPDLLEITNVARALVIARENPDIAAEAIYAQFDLPVIDPDGLDLDRLLAEATSARLQRERLEDVGRRGDGTTRSTERVQGSGILLGERNRAIAKLGRHHETLEKIDTLLEDTTNGSLPSVSTMNTVKALIKKALQ